VKALALVDSDQELKSICETINSKKNELKDRVKFFKKQIEDAQKKSNEELDPCWNALVNRLKELGKIKEYDKEKQVLQFDLDENLIMVHSKEEYLQPMMVPIQLPPGFNPFGHDHD
jgi:hypothetical protein